MPYFSETKHRHSIRLDGYDYTRAGAYFVTICTGQRANLLAKVVDGQVILSRYGKIVQDAWQVLPRHYSYVVLDAFCVMPNHVHGIIIFEATTGRGGSVFSIEMGLPEDALSSQSPLPESETRPYNNAVGRHGLPEVVRAFKSFSAQQINRLAGTKGTPFWQRNYYERIIRNGNELNTVRRYIENNPLNWEKDKEYR